MYCLALPPVDALLRGARAGGEVWRGGTVREFWDRLSYGRVQNEAMLLGRSTVILGCIDNLELGMPSCNSSWNE